MGLGGGGGVLGGGHAREGFRLGGVVGGEARGKGGHRRLVVSAARHYYDSVTYSMGWMDEWMDG